MTAPIRVLVVEDSLTVRRRLCEALAADPGLVVVGEAVDGKQAIELCRQLRPDVITMDMMLPVMTGLAATEYIMAHVPTPILIVSASTNRGELFRTYDALAAGALDVLEKPTGHEPDADWDRRLIATVKLISRIRVITHPRGKLRAVSPTGPIPRPSAAPDSPRARTERARCVAIGASTGGPNALVEVIGGLPDTFQLPLLVVLHLGKPFAHAFADWLEAQVGRRVRYCTGGEPVAGAAGGVVMAPPDAHMLIRDGRLELSLAPERHSCRPSVDVLFESVARECGAVAVGCLLTGMGRDGAAGLLAIRDAGGHTIAQDEASSVVYGMPREAVVLGAARRVLGLGAIAAALDAAAGWPGGG